jgi:hypothetical protein
MYIESIQTYLLLLLGVLFDEYLTFDAQKYLNLYFVLIELRTSSTKTLAKHFIVQWFIHILSIVSMSTAAQTVPV